MKTDYGPSALSVAFPPEPEPQPEPYPDLTERLVAAMEARWPDRAPDPTEPERLVWMRVGAIGVVAHLRAALEAQRTTSVKISEE